MNLFASSIVALDAATGQAAGWSFSGGFTTRFGIDEAYLTVDR